MNTHYDQYCWDLPTKIAGHLKILVTGATGYVGGELVPELLARGYQIRLLIRSVSAHHKIRWPGVEIVQADLFDIASLKKAIHGIDVAYYFVHSLNLGKGKFHDADLQAAKNFRVVAEKVGLKRIIYLGSLGDPNLRLSDHLMSRIQVSEELKKGVVPVTCLRAAVIIGSESASYKIIKHLIKDSPFPFVVFPKKANSNCQPIAIRDVIKYLVGCLENTETTAKTFDIGGPDILEYIDMLKIQSELFNKKLKFFSASYSNIKVYSRIASWIVPEPYHLVNALMESCANDAVCENNFIRKYIPFQTTQYKSALQKALKRESQKMLFQKRLEIKATLKRIANPNGFSPPAKSKHTLSDLRNFLLHKPKIPTLIKFNSMSEKANYSFRILQRLGVEVTNYKILNVHKIGVNAPAKYIFEELLNWDGDSSCWPNHIARVHKINNQLESLYIYLFGLKKFPFLPENSILGRKFKPLFKLNAINIQKFPDPMGSDNARYLLYKCSGGYPIGVFTMYVRSSIEYQQEKEQSQLFLMVGFNFYGKENWSKQGLLNKTWESIHDRVTSNVLNRLKQLSEWRFDKIKEVHHKAIHIFL